MMNTFEDWKNIIEDEPKELRQYLCDNCIEEVGFVPSELLEIFYEKLVEDNPYRMHSGSWPSIFENWYRPSIEETRGLGRLTTSLTNANDDFTYFTKEALIEQKWDGQDFYKMLQKKTNTFSE